MICPVSVYGVGMAYVILIRHCYGKFNHTYFINSVHEGFFGFFLNSCKN